MTPHSRGLKSAAALGARRPHGTRMRYLSGCHCFACRRANSDYERERGHARAAGDWNGIVDARRARDHLRALSRCGIGRRWVARITGVSDSILHEICMGRRPRIRARTERKILAVTRTQRAAGAVVPARRLWLLIDNLVEEGYTKTALAKALGYKSNAIQFRRNSVRVYNERRVLALHHRLTT